MDIVTGLKNRYFIWLNEPDRYHITSGDTYTWFRIAKNGTRTIWSTLRSETEARIDSSFVKFDPEQHKDKFKFCILRNPWDRLVSSYSDKVLNKELFRPCWGKGFSYFVDYVIDHDPQKCDRHIKPQQYLIPEDHIDFFGKFENLAEDFAVIAGEIGIEGSLGHKNRSARKSYKEYYDDSSAERVARYYQRDVELGGYEF